MTQLWDSNGTIGQQGQMFINNPPGSNTVNTVINRRYIKYGDLSRCPICPKTSGILSAKYTPTYTYTATGEETDMPDHPPLRLFYPPYTPEALRYVGTPQKLGENWRSFVRFLGGLYNVISLKHVEKWSYFYRLFGLKTFWCHPTVFLFPIIVNYLKNETMISVKNGGFEPRQFFNIRGF